MLSLDFSHFYDLKKKKKLSQTTDIGGRWILEGNWTSFHNLVKPQPVIRLSAFLYQRLAKAAYGVFNFTETVLKSLVWEM